MEGVEMEEPTFFMDEIEDFGNSVLSRLGNSTQEEHQHICTIIGTMSQELKDRNLPLTPVAYFAATRSSLESLSEDPMSPNHLIEASLTILSMVIPQISVAILKKDRELSKLVVKVLSSRSLTVGAVAAGLKCISHSLIVGDKTSWSDASKLYGDLLAYVTDSRPKARRQSHLCLRDVLHSFQGTPMLVPASEGIANIFKRLLLLAGGSNATPSEGPKGAQEVLYVLDALKDCLPYMSVKSTTSILKNFKGLLDLHEPLVTRRITDSLNVFCLHPTKEVSSEDLLDLLCSLALSVSKNETSSADSMTFTARLLDVGMKKMYSLNREICIIKLPVVFNALKDILAFEHEEALFASMEAFKSLIISCIDESLIKQGVDQISMNANKVARRSGPTIIEKLCATIESLLDYHYAAVWDTSFQIVSTMFDKLGDHSCYLLEGTLKSLADMQNLPDEDFPYRKQLHKCVGSALAAMGPETFLSFLPLNLDAEDQSEANVWLFPILKQYTVGSHLRFFTESILGMIGPIKQKSRKLELEGRIFSSRSTDALVYSLWSLLPSFCNYPLDTAASFKNLQKALCNALREEPDVCGMICSGFQKLIEQNKKILEEKDHLSDIEVGVPRQRVMAHYTSQVAADNLSVLRSSARDLLPILSEIFLQSKKDDGGSLQFTISEFASILDKEDKEDKEVVKKFFMTTMMRLLKVTRETINSEKSGKSNSMQIDASSNESSPLLERARLFDIAVSLLPGLNKEQIEALFAALKPALKDGEGLIQKKAYKVLSIILKSCDWFLSDNAKLEELLELMIEMLPSCHFSAKRHRLDCLYFLIVHVSKDASEKRQHGIISSFLTEIVLALKEANKKTRNRAYDVLVQIGRTCGDEDKGGKKENLHQFYIMVAGGLAAENPHAISAALRGLARLAYEFSDLVSTAYDVLPSTLLLFQRKNKEIIKASLGLVKVLVARSQAEGLQTHLRSIVEGLLKWQDNTKSQFKAKVKQLLEMLVKKCGLDAVKAVMPEEHMKLLTNIRKIKERKEKKHAASSEDSKSYQSKATTSRQSRWNHTKVFSDFGDESEDSDADCMDEKTVSGRRSKASTMFNSKASALRSKRTLKASKSLPVDSYDQLEDEPLDLLDQHKTRSALRSSDNLKRKAADSDDEPEIDPEGRLIIRDGEKSKKRETVSDPETDARSSKAMSVNSSIKNQKRRKVSTSSESGWAYTGKEYTSKKASGDVTRKDKLEPYAYWPLDRKMMSRRPEHRIAARKGMASVVKMTKKFEGRSAASALSIKDNLMFKRSQKKKGSKKNK